MVANSHNYNVECPHCNKAVDSEQVGTLSLFVVYSTTCTNCHREMILVNEVGSAGLGEEEFDNYNAYTILDAVDYEIDLDEIVVLENKSE